MNKQKQFDNLWFQLVLIEAAISRFTIKASERINLDDTFMIKYMNESSEFKNLIWRKHVLELDLDNIIT